MKKILFTFSLIVFSVVFHLHGNAKVTYNELRYDDLDLNGFNSILDTQVLSDGSYIVLSVSKSYLEDSETKSETNIYSIKSISYYLTKYNTNHEVVFKKTIASCETDDCYETYGFKNYFTQMTSLTNDDTKIILSTSNKLYVYDLLEETLELIPMSELNMIIHDLSPDSEGGFVVAGIVLQYQQVATKYKATIAKFNNEFKLEWVDFINKTSSTINSVIAIDGYYYATGQYFKAVTPGEIYGSGNNKNFITKYDRFGNLYWMMDTNQFTEKIIELRDGNILLVGSKSLSGYIATGSGPIASASMIKVNPKDGTTIWESEFSYKTPKEFVFTDAVEMENNDIIATGVIVEGARMNPLKTDDLAYQLMVEIDFLQDDRQGIMVLFNSKGTPKWKSLYDNNNMVMYRVSLLKDGKLWFTGNRFADGYEEKIYTNPDLRRKPELIGISSLVSVEELNYEKIANYSNLFYISGTILIITVTSFYFLKLKKRYWLNNHVVAESKE